MSGQRIFSEQTASRESKIRKPQRVASNTNGGGFASLTLIMLNGQIRVLKNDANVCCIIIDVKRKPFKLVSFEVLARRFQGDHRRSIDSANRGRYRFPDTTVIE